MPRIPGSVTTLPTSISSHTKGAGAGASPETTVLSRPNPSPSVPRRQTAPTTVHTGSTAHSGGGRPVGQGRPGSRWSSRAGGGPPGGHNHSSGHEKVRLDHDWYFHCAAVVEWSDLHAQGARCEQENVPPTAGPSSTTTTGSHGPTSTGQGVTTSISQTGGERSFTSTTRVSASTTGGLTTKPALPTTATTRGDIATSSSASSFDYDHSPGKDHGAAHKSPAGYHDAAGDHYHPARKLHHTPKFDDAPEYYHQAPDANHEPAKN